MNDHAVDRTDRHTCCNRGASCAEVAGQVLTLGHIGCTVVPVRQVSANQLTAFRHKAGTLANARGWSLLNVASNSPQSGRIASIVLAFDRMTMTATGRVSRFCWYSKPRSFVMSTSNPLAAAKRSNAQFSIPDHAMYAAVKTSWPANSCRN